MRSFIRLDAGALAADAHTRLTESRAEWAIVRTTRGGAVRWHAVGAETTLSHLAADPASHVSAALRLTDRSSTATTSPQALEGVGTVAATTIVLEGDRVLGVLEADDPVPEVLVSPPSARERSDSLTRRSTGARTAGTATFSADAHIDAPQRVKLAEPFSFSISLSEPAALAGEGRLVVELEAGVTTFDLDVQLFAHGFTAEPDKTGVLRVDATDVSASSITFELTATEPPPEVARLVEAGEASEWQTSITVMFLRGGPIAGSMVHPLVVELAPTGAADVIDLTDDSWLEQAESTAAVISAPALPEPDLTITLAGTAPTDGVDGCYEVTLRSPHRDLPRKTYSLSLGMDAAAFAAQKYAQIKEQDGGSLGFETVAGVGAQIAGFLGQAFWDEVNATLAAATAHHGEPPTVLLNTSDPHVPWELAHLGATPVDPTAPPFLAAQARVGRWILDPRNHIEMPPSTRFRVDNVAAVIGEYDPMEMKKGTWKRLPEAEAEGQFLRDRYGAAPLSAERETVSQLLARKVDPPPQLVHFACHGTSMPGSTALIANDGTSIPDIVFERSVAGREDRPFIFLNACRVGAAAEAANQYGGFAGSFLRAGSTGFIGPLWEVDDTVAKDIATDFYDSIARGEGPAEILRRTRAQFVDAGADATDPPSTYMAYVYYGHPATMITGVRRELVL